MASSGLGSHSARGAGRQQWETSEFPVLCSNCLGPSPFVRMIRADAGKECKVCTRPFTVFRWKGGPKARFKQTEICQTCAKLKNLCQTCLLDLQYQIPAQVRDSILGQSNAVVDSKNEVMREFYANEAERQLAENGDAAGGGKAASHAVLERFARQAPYYERNKARVCSFWMKGTCNRGALCPYRHEDPGYDPALAKQNQKDRYYGRNDPVAEKMLRRVSDTRGLMPPEDESITTLHIAGLPPGTKSADVMDVFCVYGDVTTLRVLEPSSSAASVATDDAASSSSSSSSPSSSSAAAPAAAPSRPTGELTAFVTYRDRDSAVRAMEAQFAKCEIRGVKVRLSWGRRQQADTAFTNAHRAGGDSNYAASNAPPASTPAGMFVGAAPSAAPSPSMQAAAAAMGYYPQYAYPVASSATSSSSSSSSSASAATPASSSSSSAAPLPPPPGLLPTPPGMMMMMPPPPPPSAAVAMATPYYASADPNLLGSAPRRERNQY